MNGYLIPANSKKSMLYFGLFNSLDLWIFGIGVAVSLLLLVILPIDIFWVAVLAIAPGCIAGFLVIPVPNYHNIRTIISLAFEFYTTRQRFIWKGWCYGDGEETRKK